jgi:hypothetical protein
MVMPQVAALLKGGTHVPPMKQYSKKNNNKLRSMHVKEKNDVKTTAALLRTTEERKS